MGRFWERLGPAAGGVQNPWPGGSQEVGERAEKGGKVAAGVQGQGRTPIEPSSGSSRGGRVVRWVFFLLFLLYLTAAYLHTPLLRQLGAFLVVEQEPARSDLIVCLMGAPVERGLATADAFGAGYAPRVFVAREALPDGWDTLGARKVHYPESRDLLLMMLGAMGVPRAAVMTSDRFVDSTYEEALLVRETALRSGFRSVLVVTSPIHTRRAGLTYRRVFKGQGVKVTVTASPYSGFRAEDWWTRERYLQAVVIETLKLVYYWLRYL